MQRLEVETRGFQVLARTSRSQAASMTLEPDETTGGPTNRHEQSDQWMFVVSGSGRASVSGRDVVLEPGVLLLIEAGETHEIRCTGDRSLRTLNVYCPPVY